MLRCGSSRCSPGSNWWCPPIRGHGRESVGSGTRSFLITDPVSGAAVEVIGLAQFAYERYGGATRAGNPEGEVSAVSGGELPLVYRYVNKTL